MEIKMKNNGLLFNVIYPDTINSLRTAATLRSN